MSFDCVVCCAIACELMRACMVVWQLDNFKIVSIEQVFVICHLVAPWIYRISGNSEFFEKVSSAVPNTISLSC
jgi:hypothetical protein